MSSLIPRNFRTQPFVAVEDTLVRAAASIKGDHAGFRVSRFRYDTRSDLIHSEFVNCSLLLMPQRVMEFLLLYLEKNVRLEGLQRKETHDLPISSLRETNINAILSSGLLNKWFTK